MTIEKTVTIAQRSTRNIRSTEDLRTAVDKRAEIMSEQRKLQLEKMEEEHKITEYLAKNMMTDLLSVNWNRVQHL